MAQRRWIGVSIRDGGSRSRFEGPGRGDAFTLWEAVNDWISQRRVEACWSVCSKGWQGLGNGYMEDIEKLSRISDGGALAIGPWISREPAVREYSEAPKSQEHPVLRRATLRARVDHQNKNPGFFSLNLTESSKSTATKPRHNPAIH